MVKHNWRDIAIDHGFLAYDTKAPTKKKDKIAGRAYYRTECLSQLDNGRAGDMTEMYMADFVYVKDTQVVVKNRLGSVEDLYESALSYDRLRWHPDPRVAAALEKVETLAALID